MPFKPLEFDAASIKKAGKTQASISYKRNATKASSNRRPKLIIGLPAAVATQLKYRPDDKFIIQIGSGPEKNKIRIVKSTDGNGVHAHPLRLGSCSFRFGYVPMLGESAAEREYVHTTVLKDGLELHAPAWFKED